VLSYITCSQSQILRSIVGLICLLSASNLWSATTYSGTNGVQSKLLLQNSVSACSGCHFNGAVDPDFTSSYTAFSSYATTYHAGNKLNAVQRMMDRTNLATDDISFMPQGGGSQISSAEKALLSAWKSNLAVDVDNPTTITLATISGKGKNAQATSDSAFFTVYANVDDSGIDATSYTFQYGLSQTPSFESSAQVVAGSGGGTETTQISQLLTSLECGQTYHYRVKASNTSYSSTVGDWQEEDTPACNTAPIIQNTPLSPSDGSEDVLFQFDVDANDSEADDITYGLVNEPDGMTINSSGLVSWTPLEGITTSGLVTVTAADDGDDGVSADTATFSISVTSINDAPQITSIATTSAIEGNQYSYQVDVNDPDDSGTALAYSVGPITGDMSISPSGLLTWIPGNGITTSGFITVTVADGGENSAAAATQEFEILVAGVNTAPSITSVAPTAASEDILYEYAVEVVDLDDANNGTDLNFSLSNSPSGMTISNQGLIQWTPLEGQGNANTITVTVSDGGENGTQPSRETFSIIVTSINDAPQLSSPGAQAITELESLAINFADLYTDPDDDNDGSELTWQLISAPVGMALSSLGNLSWSSTEESAGDYSIQLSLSDGGENSAAAATINFPLTVNLLDGDNDLIADYVDNCPDLANNDQANFDNDNLGDVCDLDDDDDTLPDAVELANGLDPFNGDDAVLDADADGDSNATEYQQCLVLANEESELCGQILLDSVAPEITTNGEQIVVSSGYLTEVELTAEAFDVKDGESLVAADTLGPFRPGKHIVIWQAQDIAGNVAQVEQVVKVIPLIKFLGSQQYSVEETAEVKIPVSLSGSAADYPVVIDYLLSGSASNSEHDLIPGQIQIESGLTGEIVFNWIGSNAEVSNLESIDKNIIIELSASNESAFLADNLTYQVDFLAGNVIPSAELFLTQRSEQRVVIYQNQGAFFISAKVADKNNDELTIKWLTEHEQLILPENLVNNELRQIPINPANLPLGFYNLGLAVSDAESSFIRNLSFRVEAQAPLLNTGSDSDNDGISDDIEGLLDSDSDGIQDYLDPIDDAQYMHKNILANDLFETSNQLLETEPGLIIKAGQWAIEQGQAGVGLAADDLANIENDNSAKNIIGEVFDFEIHGISLNTSSIKLVIPLAAGIPLNAEYWKYDGSRWSEFEVHGEDYIATAFKQAGRCPSADSDRYTLGLIPFSQCLLLSITDGGNNDTDGAVNGVVTDPGAIVMDSLLVVNENKTLTKPTSSPGAGYFSIIFMILLLSLASFRAQAEFNFQTLFQLGFGSDDNVSRAQHSEDIIYDNFARLDGHLIFDYELSFNKSISVELQAAHQAYQHTELLSKNEVSARLIYRWQNSFHYNSPWYQLFSDISHWDLGEQQRDSTLYTQQAMVSARLTTKISGSLGAEYQSRDSESRVFDLKQSRIFAHLDYTWSDSLSFYSGYSYIQGDTVSTVQGAYCNGLIATSVYPILTVSKEVEWDQIFNDAYCGQWISYRLEAVTQTLVLGGNYGFDHSSSLDLSWFYADVDAKGDNYYQRQIIQLNYLKAF